MHKLSGSAQTILSEGMGGRLKTKHGQLTPLKSRLTPYQAAKRTAKITARRTVAEQLSRQQVQYMTGVTATLRYYFARGFFGRMKWLLLGR